jgi:hypothetical protein
MTLCRATKLKLNHSKFRRMISVQERNAETQRSCPRKKLRTKAIKKPKAQFSTLEA